MFDLISNIMEPISAGENVNLAQHGLMMACVLMCFPCEEGFSYVRHMIQASPITRCIKGSLDPEIRKALQLRIDFL